MGKKHKRKAIEDEDLNAGVFKKALVTPAQAVGSSAYNGASLNELDLMGAMDSSSDVDSSEDEAPKNKGNRAASSGVVRGLSNIEATKVEEDTASAVMANMASLFANAGHSQEGHTGAHQQQQSHPMGEDVMQMQQQLQMLLQESMSSGSTGHQQHEQSIPIQDTTALLMNISNDPSILATVSNAQSTSSLAGETTTRKEKSHKKKKSKSNDHEHSHHHESAASSSSSKVSSAPKRTLEEQMEFDMAGSSDNPLHTKWMMATALKEKGIAYRTGTFSSQEDQLIRQTIRDYVARHNMAEDSIKRWFENGNGRGRFEKNDLKALWVEIAVRLQTRPLLNIYLHVRRMFHPQNNIGQWTKQDDEKLVALYQKHKGQWTVIGQELGRMADSCRDRYRNHLKDQDTMKSGTWAPEEDEKLLSIMQELAAQQGKSNILESTHMWTLISEKMGGTRSRHQCRHRFSQTLQPRLERGEWTGPSSAAARAAASVAESVKETTTIAKHSRPQPGVTHSQSSQSSQPANFTAADELRVLTEALQGAIPSTSENLLWTQAMTTSTANDNANSNEYDELAAAIAAAASLPNPGNIPKAPKGPIRRKGGLQQQLDVLKMIQEFGYKDHTEIKWGELAKQLRSRVEESNTAQLAKIMQQHEHLESQLELQQHQGGYSSAAASATATAAATHAMAAAVAAAQQENVQSLQKLPAANQLTRTFMSTRCKTEGYREMTLQEVVKVMIGDVEQRIKRRNARYAAAAADVEVNGAETSTPTSSVATATGMVQQQNMNDAAQHAALAMLSAQFPACNGKKGAVAVGSPSARKDSETAIESDEAAFPDSERRRTASQQQEDHDVAEKMLTTALINSELIPTLNRGKPPKPVVEPAADPTVKSSEYLTDTSDESDGDE
ncbi:RNA polymerase I enhancer binding protein [Mortierella alpina]|uniref:RNA polymerase I enhancer binding protein n=1 Tax=Mortierella alpina TaxID=64518 RepID=A0A9P6JBV9_MORAP|nr:RNA polymerase I enhancer binding protein [Mortierella alpina]